MGKDSKSPYAEFGHQLKALRLKEDVTIEQLSGALELPDEQLAMIEKGELRPNEEVVEMLINYFNLSDDIEEKLWELAGYRQDNQMPDMGAIASIMLMPFDGRVVYSDQAQVSINNYGVVMNFMQTNGAGGKPMAISRIGMSREHAESVMLLLKQALEAGESSPKLLDNPDKKS